MYIPLIRPVSRPRHCASCCITRTYQSVASFSGYSSLCLVATLSLSFHLLSTYIYVRASSTPSTPTAIVLLHTYVCRKPSRNIQPTYLYLAEIDNVHYVVPTHYPGRRWEEVGAEGGPRRSSSTSYLSATKSTNSKAKLKNVQNIRCTLLVAFLSYAYRIFSPG